MPALNTFAGTDESILAPYTRAVTLTPNDSTDLTEVTRGVLSAGAGSHHSIVVTLAGDTDGTNVTLTTANGAFVPVRIKRLWSTGTTATSVIGLY